jgi:SAM-dependent methyltransferase
MERAGLKPQAFDAIWLSRTLHSAADPSARLCALARLLRPGGRLIVVESDYAHHPLLAWPAHFERQVLTAHFQYMQSRSGPRNSLERYHSARHLPGWLRRAGLRLAFLHTYLSEDIGPLAPEAEEYWRLTLQWLGGRILPFLSPGDREQYLELCNPKSPDYLLAQPNAYCVELTTVGCGIAAE